MKIDDIASILGCNSSTTREIICDWCKTTYNKGANDENEDEIPGESVRWVNFGGSQVAECCMQKLADALLGYAESTVKLLEYKVGQLSGQLHGAKQELQRSQTAVNQIAELDSAIGEGKG